ncbi:MAG: hypothetical protein IJE14_00430 [Clostridia bacterium]|nr:hypothetical protein [Clostridia bacterium]
MAQKNNAYGLKHSELQDLSFELQEVIEEKVNCFYRYTNKKNIGLKIYNTLKNKYEEDKNRFVFSDDIQESGILPMLQGYCSLLNLFNDFNINLPESEIKEWVDTMIDNLLNHVDNNLSRYKIDMSPYLPDSTFFDNNTYIDSATWIIATILGIVRLHIGGKYLLKINDDREKKLFDLYRFCVKYINDSYIEVPDSAKFNCGWHFTKNCEEPSLYFTFAVSEILIDMLITFENVVRNDDVELIKGEIREQLDTIGILKSSKYQKNKDLIEKILFENTNTSDANKSLYSNLNGFTEQEIELIIEIYNKYAYVESECSEFCNKINQGSSKILREKEMFFILNNGKKTYDYDSPYRILEEKCKNSANRMWDLTKDNLIGEFFSFDLSSIISEEAINCSISSDALFNSIFVINTIINAGIDEDYEDKINYFTINGSKEYDEALKNYDNLRATLRLSYENCYQYFMRLKEDDKDYKINEYTLSFDEKINDNHAGIVRDMRKSHIRVFSLMPLIARTKTTISDFVIRYPQYDMLLYLEQILKYRSWDSATNEYLWIWENGGYSTSSCYYFISALSSFYSYYSEYEEQFLANANANKEKKSEIEKNYHSSLLEKGKAVDKDLADFKTLEQEREELKKQIINMQLKIDAYESDPLRSALSGFIMNVLREGIIGILAEQMSAEATRIISSVKETIENKTNGVENIELEEWKSTKSDSVTFEKGMRDILLALTAEQMGETLYSVHDNREERTKALNSIEKYVTQHTDTDMKMALRYYLKGIAEKGNHKSYFVTNRGETNLANNRQRALDGLLEEKINKGE